LFVPKIPSYKITEVAKAIGPECELKFVGLRPGEKVHEEMITVADSFFTYDLGKYYVIVPFTHDWPTAEFIKKFNAIKVPPGFRYNSGENEKFLSVEELKSLIREHVEPNL